MKWLFVPLVLLTLGVGTAWGDTELTFSLTSNPGGWPTTNSTTLTNYTYTLSGTNYTFALSNVKQNSGYLMLTSTAVLGLPAISGMTLTKVVVSNSGSCSTSTRVGISSSSSSASYISGGAYQTYSTTSSTYTYNLTGTSANTMYYLYVTNKNCQITQLKLTYSGGSTPSLTPTPTSLDWGSVLQTSSQSTKTFSISGSNLTGNLSVAVTGGYSVSCGSSITVTSGTPNVTTITVTPPSTSTTGTKNGTVTISGGGLASNVVVNLSMTVNAASTVTWMNNGSEYTTTLVANGSKPTFPSNPSSCDATSTTFVGWSTSAWSGKLDDVSAKTIYTSASAMPNVSEPVTYHAVFAKATANTYIKGTKDDLTDGQTVLIVNPSASVALKGDKSALSVSISNNKIVTASTAVLWTVEPHGSGYYFKYGSDYLNSYSNTLYVDYYTDEWSVSGSGPYVLTSGNNTTKSLQYYNSTWKMYDTGSTAYFQMDFYIPDCSQYLTNCCTALGTINGSFS